MSFSGVTGGESGSDLQHYYRPTPRTGPLPGILSISLQSKDNVSRFLQLSRSLDGL